MIPDETSGKPGQRVRRGLGTDSKEDAERIVADINTMLADKDYWTLGARDTAVRKFHAKAVSAFYDHDRLRASLADAWEKRNVVPLPTSAGGYSVVQLVGAFGVGKTTLLRQLIGTDNEERFPSTSKGRTTICDTEIICSSGPYSAVVSFLSRDRVRAHVEECVEAAVLAAADGMNDSLVSRKFLEHSELRFRLPYILGKLEAENAEADSDEDIDDEESEQGNAHSEISDEERKSNAQKLRAWIEQCKEVAARAVRSLEEETGDSAEELSHKDKDAFLQLVQERLDEDNEVQETIDEIVAAIEERFRFIQTDCLEVDNSGWAVRWQLTTDDRADFLQQVGRFSSNYAPQFGRLLTPLVDGIRVKGPFKPRHWAPSDEIPSLVLLDGEGLGHVTETATTVPTAVTRRFGIANAILLVDTAETAMSAGPQAVLRSVVSCGHESKLCIAFTHFDQMRGDNFTKGSDIDKKDFVLASLEQAIVSLDDALDSQAGASRRVRRQLQKNTFFLGHLHKALHEKAKGTRKDLQSLIGFLLQSGKPQVPTEAVPCYDLAYLFPRIQKATDEFQQLWNARLGLTYREGVKSEHWKRIEALTRRFAKQWDDKYLHLQPVAQLRSLLTEGLLSFVATPKAWKNDGNSQDAKDAAIQKVAQKVSARLESYLSRRFCEDQLNAWCVAYGRSGRGSGKERARDVRGIDEDVAPIPSEERVSKLFDDIRQLFRDGIREADGEVFVS